MSAPGSRLYARSGATATTRGTARGYRDGGVRAATAAATSARGSPFFFFFLSVSYLSVSFRLVRSRAFTRRPGDRFPSPAYAYGRSPQDRPRRLWCCGSVHSYNPITMGYYTPFYNVIILLLLLYPFRSTGEWVGQQTRVYYCRRTGCLLQQRHNTKTTILHKTYLKIQFTMR